MKIRWYGGPPTTHRKIVRNNPGIGAYNLGIAHEIGVVAAARLTPHNINHDKYRRPGDGRSFITVEPGSRGVDAFVNLNDPDNHGLVLEGKLNILRGAALG